MMVAPADRKAGREVLLFEAPSRFMGSGGDKSQWRRDSGERTGLQGENQRGELQSRGTVENKDE